MNKYVIFGFNYLCKWLINEVGSNRIECIIDNNEKICGEKYKGVPVISLAEYVESDEHYKIVIAATKYEEDIVKQLREYGINEFVSVSSVWGECILKGKDNRNTIFLMNTHSYTNGGDYLITIAQKNYINTMFPDKELVLIPSMVCGKNVNDLKDYIGEKSLLLISGGGYLGNLWMENGESNVREIIKKFPENNIVIMPQSMFFTDDAEGEKEKNITKHIYDNHSDLLVCLRERKSYKMAEEMFEKAKIMLVPDITFVLEHKKSQERRNVAVCLREDKESILQEEQREILNIALKKMDENVEVMKMEVHELLSETEAETEVKSKMTNIQKCKLVITDRLHCMMMCYITGTPCLVFDNLSKKISGSYEYITDAANIILFNRGCDIENLIQRIINIGSIEKIYRDNMKKYEELTDYLKRRI